MLLQRGEKLLLVGGSSWERWLCLHFTKMVEIISEGTFNREPRNNIPIMEDTQDERGGTKKKDIYKGHRY